MNGKIRKESTSVTEQGGWVNDLKSNKKRKGNAHKRQEKAFVFWEEGAWIQKKRERDRERGSEKTREEEYLNGAYK